MLSKLHRVKVYVTITALEYEHGFHFIKLQLRCLKPY